jgi:hypothetical protein
MKSVLTVAAIVPPIMVTSTMGMIIEPATVLGDSERMIPLNKFPNLDPDFTILLPPSSKE